MATELITALDVDTESEALEAVKACAGCMWFKVGLQLFVRSGPQIVTTIRESGENRVFLDLKYHDIPNTVGQAARSAADLGASLITLHAAGGRKMIAAAREAVEGTDTRILAVTVLTSLDDRMLRDEVGLPETAREAVPRLARMAVESGAHGVVASPHEASGVRAVVGKEALLVTPGIRPAWASAGDQARFTTPREAAEAGADFIVVGRPILKSPNPGEAVEHVLKELRG